MLRPDQPRTHPAPPSINARAATAGICVSERQSVQVAQAVQASFSICSSDSLRRSVVEARPASSAPAPKPAIKVP